MEESPVEEFDEDEDMEFEVIMPLTSEELYNNVAVCTNAYDFLDRSKDDLTIIELQLDVKVKKAMGQCIETVCALIEELHLNTVFEDEGE